MTRNGKVDETALDAQGLAEELVKMAEEDRAVRAALATGRSLFDGYHPCWRCFIDGMPSG